MSESRNVAYVSRQKEFNDRIEANSKNNPIDERAYSKELFMMGREEALLDMKKITEDQRIYLKTGYTGDIKDSVNYLRGYKRGIELSITNNLPQEYLEENKRHR